LLGEFADDALPTDARHDPESLVLEYARARELWTSMCAHLTVSEYLVAALSFRLGAPDSEIARVTGTSEGTVRSHRSRAMKKMGDIDPRVFFPDCPRYYIPRS